MSRGYEDALQQVLEAVRRGQTVDAAVQRFPEHAEALRADARLAESIARSAAGVPSARPEARVDASRRMLARLDTERAAPAGHGSFLGFGWLRYVAAAVVVAVAVLGVALLLQGGGSSVEASTIEGVVVDNQDGVLTVQTVDALEHIEVPAGAPVSDVAGAALNISGIEAGQVVVIDLERRGPEAVAHRVQRYTDSLEAWCDGNSARCRALTAGLQRAQEACARASIDCRFAVDRLEELRRRASDTVSIEELKSGCRGGLDAACREIVRFCRDAAGACGVEAPDLPPGDRPAVTRRLEALNSACLRGDEGACRLLARACNLFADLCPVDAPGPDDLPPTPSLRPNVAPPHSDTPAPSPPEGRMDSGPAPATPSPTETGDSGVMRETPEREIAPPPVETFAGPRSEATAMPLTAPDSTPTPEDVPPRPQAGRTVEPAIVRP